MLRSSELWDTLGSEVRVKWTWGALAYYTMAFECALKSSRRQVLVTGNDPVCSSLFPQHSTRSSKWSWKRDEPVRSDLLIRNNFLSQHTQSQSVPNPVSPQLCIHPVPSRWKTRDNKYRHFLIGRYKIFWFSLFWSLLHGCGLCGNGLVNTGLGSLNLIECCLGWGNNSLVLCPLA